MQIAADRRYIRRPRREQIRRAFAEGATIYMPQIHQVLPRVARLMAQLRAALFGPGREECSFLFLVNGKGRQGLGLHHDGEVDSVWLQLEGRRTVTTGPPVPRGTAQDLDERVIGRGWVTRQLAPGSLFYLPPRTPHRVVCHGRSLALSFTWKSRSTPPMGARAARAITSWDVTSGRALPMPRVSADTVWTQVPVSAGPVDRKRGDFTLRLPGGTLRLPASSHALARRLASMPALRRASLGRAAQPLLDAGVLGSRDLPLRIVPAKPHTLDGWRFA
ncbi:MAG TPA: cupin domain-containing protein [Candidatus Bathyarchaeia archaeon]|nr:cupin domain-containing protein [Candidatus Bathyarchaeia archaeon]